MTPTPRTSDPAFEPRPPESTAAHAAPRAGGLPVATLLGVRVFVDWSLLIVFALILFDLALGVFPAWHPEWGPALAWSTALGAALLFFASILVHELAHAVVARRNDIPVSRITLFLFGGLTHMEDEPPSPKSEFLMAVVGPLTSIALGLAALALGAGLAGPDFSSAFADDPSAAVAGLGPAASLLLWLGPINLLLGLFNLLPGFPLDGGRVFRSVAWWITGDLRRATRWASGAGSVLAWALMAWGVVSLLGGGFLQGLWLLLIGWFLGNAARASYQQLVVRESLHGVPLSMLMRTRFSTLTPSTDLQTLVREELMASGQRAFPVVDDEGVLCGLVCLEDIRAVPPTLWADTRVESVMTPTEELATLPPDAPADEALRALSERGVDQVPVLEGRRPVGLVRSQDVVKWLSLRTDLADRAVPARP